MAHAAVVKLAKSQSCAQNRRYTHLTNLMFKISSGDQKTGLFKSLFGKMMLLSALSTGRHYSYKHTPCVP